MSWKLKRTQQCEKCPWIVGVDPHDIPNGYSEERHRALRDTIATSPIASLLAPELQIMACHETHDAHCIGWLVNQLGRGNNLALRMHIRACDNAGAIRLRGEQHKTFEDTLP
jgi:hypothetical protein